MELGKLALLALALAGCRSAQPIRLATAAGPGGQTLTLLAAPGFRINARLAPALELPNGQVIRFASSEVTADSSYFTAAPTAWLAGDAASPHGRLRAGVCEKGSPVCRVVTVELALSHKP